MQELVIEPKANGRAYWRDLWRFRELFYSLPWRDLLVRYKQTFMGIGMGFIQPVKPLSAPDHATRPRGF